MWHTRAASIASPSDLPDTEKVVESKDSSSRDCACFYLLFFSATSPHWAVSFIGLLLRSLVGGNRWSPADKTLRFSVFFLTKISHRSLYRRPGTILSVNPELWREEKEIQKMIDLKIEKRCGNFSGYWIGEDKRIKVRRVLWTIIKHMLRASILWQSTVDSRFIINLDSP